MIPDIIAEEIEEKSKIIAKAAVEKQYHLQPEIWERYGEKGREQSIRDINYHLSYLSEAVKSSDPSIFVNYVLWLKELFAGLNFPDKVLPVTLECMRNVLKEMLTPEMTKITNEYIGAGIEKLKEITAENQSFISDDSPYSDLAKEYLDNLLKGDRNRAGNLIMDAVKEGVSIQDIYLHVFQASQYEIGRLWHTKQVSVAQEHYCSAATERIMSQLYPYIFTTKRIGKTYIGACVGGELHQIGARMVADFFELDGWDTYYMGANTPAQSILEAICEHNADILGVSCTMSLNRSGLKELITDIRSSDNIQKHLNIIVGGYSFIQKPDLWKEIGADGSAVNAKEALKLANQLVMK